MGATGLAAVFVVAIIVPRVNEEFGAVVVVLRLGAARSGGLVVVVVGLIEELVGGLDEELVAFPIRAGVLLGFECGGTLVPVGLVVVIGLMRSFAESLVNGVDEIGSLCTAVLPACDGGVVAMIVARGADFL